VNAENSEKRQLSVGKTVVFWQELIKVCQPYNSAASRDIILQVQVFRQLGIRNAVTMQKDVPNVNPVGAVAGHVAGGMKRSDLKDLGELLDNGTSGLLVVAATDVEARVDAAITRAKKRAKARLQADTDALKQELDRAA
jgi:hypothetical protein